VVPYLLQPYKLLLPARMRNLLNGVHVSLRV
jgi:hypothetical protein